MTTPTPLATLLRAYVPRETHNQIWSAADKICRAVGDLLVEALQNNNTVVGSELLVSYDVPQDTKHQSLLVAVEELRREGWDVDFIKAHGSLPAVIRVGMRRWQLTLKGRYE